MKVSFGQIYIDPEARFPFTHLLQRRLSEEVTALAAPSPKFAKQYGIDFDLIIRISAKRMSRDNEIKGPTVFRRARDVEYTIFLPFDVITCDADPPKAALRFLLNGVCSVFESLDIDTVKISERQNSLIDQIVLDRNMLDHKI